MKGGRVGVVKLCKRLLPLFSDGKIDAGGVRGEMKENHVRVVVGFSGFYGLVSRYIFGSRVGARHCRIPASVPRLGHSHEIYDRPGK